MFPGAEHGVLAGDEYELTDGERTEVVTLAAAIAAGEETATLGIEESVGESFDGDRTVLRPARSTLRDEIVGVRDDFEALGWDPSAFVFPYDAADSRAWQLAADEYDAVANAAARSLPNPPGTNPTNLRRYYLERTHRRRVEIETYLDSVAQQGGVGILAGHSAWESVPPERVGFVIEAALARGIEITTFAEITSA